jgi:hypothetical protein
MAAWMVIGAVLMALLPGRQGGATAARRPATVASVA